MKFYRYEIFRYASGNEDYGYVPSLKLTLHEYNLYKETPKGYWIGYGFLGALHSECKWVSKTSKKRFAYPTKEEALVNYIKRTERRMGYLNAQMMECKEGINKAKQFLENESND